MAAAGTLALGTLASAQSSTASKINSMNEPLTLNMVQGPSANENSAPSFFALRAGAALPVSTSLSDVSSIFLAAGVDFTFSNNIFKDAETYLSIDWLGRTRGNARFNLFPLAINERFYFKPGATGKFGAATGSAYGFVGVGGTIYDFSNSTLRFSGRVGIGEMFTQNWLFEASLFLSMPVNGVNANAVGVYAGYKFGG